MGVGDALRSPSGRSLARFGSVFPFAVLAVINIAAAVVNSATGHGIAWGVTDAVILGCAAIGQIAVWTALAVLRKDAGRDTGILVYLWLGGAFTALALLSTSVFYLAVIPFLPPLAATIARTRSRSRTPVHPTATT